MIFNIENIYWVYVMNMLILIITVHIYTLDWGANPVLVTGDLVKNYAKQSPGGGLQKSCS